MRRNQPAPRHRQEIALCLLFDEALHRLMGRTYVQKVVFLFQQRADSMTGTDPDTSRYVSTISTR